jgi:cysteine synthase A
MTTSDTAWLHNAMARIEADYQRSADTHLMALPLPGFARYGIDLYLKDESTHPTGSLKHLLARSLFLYAVCNGWLHEGSTVVETSWWIKGPGPFYVAPFMGRFW